jgi:hypothetical protein
MANYYLIRFKYDYYCQGFEEGSETLLVKCNKGFEAACNRIKIFGKFINAREFENLTIDFD